MSDLYKPQPITATLIKRLAAAAPPGKPKEVRDHAAGLILRHQPASKGEIAKARKQKRKPKGYVGLYVILGRGKRERLCDARLIINPSSDLTIGKVKARARTVRGQHDTGRDFAAERKTHRATPTLTEYLNDTFEPWATKNRRSGPATVARLRACFQERFGKSKLTAITPDRLEKWKDGRGDVTPETVRRDIGALHAALNRAVKLKVIKANPLAGVEPPETDPNKRVVRALTAAEKRKLLDALAARDDAKRAERASANEWRLQRGYDPLPPIGRFADALTPAVIVSLETGCRRGELFALEWTRVDFKEKTLRVEGSTSKTYETRDIPLHSVPLETVRNWWLQCGQPDKGLVFHIDGKRLTSLRKSYYAVLADAGIKRVNRRGERVNWHSLRHTFGSLLGASLRDSDGRIIPGIDGPTLMRLMGHANLRTTQRYLHTDEERMREAVERLQAST